MIIDCHGHHPTAPAGQAAWRRPQLEAWGIGAAAPAHRRPRREERLAASSEPADAAR